MCSVRPLVIAVGLILSGQVASAQDMSRYGVYVLESTVDSVDRDRTEGLTNRDIIGSISGSLWHARARTREDPDQPTCRDAA